MKIALGADHAGYDLKNRIKEHLTERGITVEDKGTNSGESCDYPDFAQAVAEDVAQHRADSGILVYGTGIGMSIAANKVPGIRAALCADAQTARGARWWNDANVLVMSLRATSPDVAREILDAWFSESVKEGEKPTIAQLQEIEARHR